MITLKEGEKRKVAARVERLTGSGQVSVTTPERRIVDVNRNLIAGFDWAACTWDATLAEIFTIFDSTVAGLTAANTYYVQLRGTIGSERYGKEIKVVLEDWGP